MAARHCIMTPAERECFVALITEMGMDYHFFPQVHLDSIVHPTNSHRRFQAFRHINQKSVDFVACDKTQLRPLFVIGLAATRPTVRRDALNGIRKLSAFCTAQAYRWLELKIADALSRSHWRNVVQRGIEKYATTPA